MEGRAYLLQEREAAQVESWARGARLQSLVMQDAFGVRVELSRGQRAFRLERRDALPEGHPLRSLLTNLEGAIAENGSESLLIALLAKNDPVHRALLNDLLSSLAASPEAANAASARRLVTGWALQHRAEIGRALGKGAERIFLDRATLTRLQASGDHPFVDQRIRTPDYTEEHHALAVRNYEGLLAHPELGAVILNANGATKRILHADVDQVREVLGRGERTIRHFDFVNDQWKNLTLADENVLIEQSPIHASPDRLGMCRLMLKLYGDPRLMDLGWLIASTKGTPFANLLNDLLMPIARTLPGQEAPMTLLQAQEEAVGAWRDVNEGPLSEPEVDRVRLRTLVDGARWRNVQGADPFNNGVDALLARVEERLQASAPLRRSMARLYLMGQLGRPDLADPGVLRANLGRALDAARAEALPWDEVIALERETMRLYRDARGEVLRNRGLLQEATGMHAPEATLPLTSADAVLAASHPETGVVGVSMRWAIARVIKDGRVQAPPEFVRFIELFPEFANVAAIATVVHVSIPFTFMAGIVELTQEYDRIGAWRDAGAVELIRGRFRELYGQHADAIRAALQREVKPGVTAARLLTGIDEPWKPADDWQRYAPAVRLRAIAPEVDRMFPIPLNQGMEPLPGEDEVAAVAPNMLYFAQQHPAFGPAVVMLSLVYTWLPEEVRSGKVDPFFTGDSGPWRAEPGREAEVEEAFVKLFTEPRTLSAIRTALTRPQFVGHDESIAEVITGEEHPWLPANPLETSFEERAAGLLPEGDAAAIQQLEGQRLQEHVASRVASLGILPANRKELQKSIGLWRLREEEWAAAGKLAVGNLDKASDAFVRIMLLLERLDQQQWHAISLRSELYAMPFEGETPRLRHAYRFLLRHRLQVGRAMHRAATGGGKPGPKKAGGNNGAGGNTATSGSNAGSAPPSSAPISGFAAPASETAAPAMPFNPLTTSIQTAAISGNTVVLGAAVFASATPVKRGL